MSINPIDAGVLIDLLSFSVRDAVEARLRSFGGDRQRWVVLGVAAAAAWLGSAATLTFLFDALGLRGGPVTEVSTPIAILRQTDPIVKCCALPSDDRARRV